jgi:hypothetical protein
MYGKDGQREAYHALLVDEGEEGLSPLFDGFVECLRGRVIVGPEDFVLSKEHALCNTRCRMSLVKVDCYLRILPMS